MAQVFDAPAQCLGTLADSTQPPGGRRPRTRRRLVGRTSPRDHPVPSERPLGEAQGALLGAGRGRPCPSELPSTSAPFVRRGGGGKEPLEVRPGGAHRAFLGRGRVCGRAGVPAEGKCAAPGAHAEATDPNEARRKSCEGRQPVLADGRSPRLTPLQPGQSWLPAKGLHTGAAGRRLLRGQQARTLVSTGCSRGATGGARRSFRLSVPPVPDRLQRRRIFGTDCRTRSSCGRRRPAAGLDLSWLQQRGRPSLGRPRCSRQGDR